MRRSTVRFVTAFVVMVASGAALIAVIPSALGAGAPLAGWLPFALCALFAASALAAFRVRPAGGARHD